MNYLALAAGIFAALLALYTLARILRAAAGKIRLRSAWGIPLNALWTALTGTLAVWLFGMVA